MERMSPAGEALRPRSLFSVDSSGWLTKSGRVKRDFSRIDKPYLVGIQIVCRRRYTGPHCKFEGVSVTTSDMQLFAVEVDMRQNSRT